MATQTMEFSAAQVRDFNTRPQDQLTDGSTTIRANGNSPSRLLDANATATDPTHSNVLNGATVTNYRATFETDADNEVVPGSDVGIEYSTDNGVTWRDFYADSNLGEEGYTPYKVYLDGGTNADGPNASDEWISIVATSAANPDGTGFMLADQPITTGQLFRTFDDPNANSEFSLVCFTTGMPIETESGNINVEDLSLGDMVRTLDNGYQPIRFIYRRKVRAIGAMRPVVFEAGTLGNKERFVVSQRHRIHTKSVMPNLLKNNDYLIEAIELVDGSSVRVSDEFEYVEYFHIMFDRHELIYSHGIVSESWQPHKRNLKRDARLKAELLEIFPEIAMNGSKVDPRPARQTVKFAQHS